MSVSSWYEIVSNDKQILQGDFIQKCPVLIPKSDPDSQGVMQAEIIYADCIVLTQSCDLLKKKTGNVILCEYLGLSEYLKNVEPKITSRVNAKVAFENLRKGHLHSYHLLSKSESPKMEYVVVLFKNLYSIPFEVLKNCLADERIRLLSPYREHLSQSFARYFMRVGLPSDIKPEDIPDDLTFD